MSECLLCQMPKELLLVDDENISAFFSPNPSSSGEILIAPKKHIPIIETMPDDILGQIMVLSNKVALMQFETLECLGVNLLIQNGLGAKQQIPHFFISMIPRYESDNLEMTWKGSPRNEEELSSSEMAYKSILTESPKEETQKQIEIKEDYSEKDYRVKSLGRLP